MKLFVCHHPECDNYSACEDDVVSVTCAARVPHLAERACPDMVPVALLKQQAAVYRPAKSVVEETGNRACRSGEPASPHPNPALFWKLGAAVREADYAAAAGELQRATALNRAKTQLED